MSPVRQGRLPRFEAPLFPPLTPDRETQAVVLLNTSPSARTQQMCKSLIL